ncbi:MAG TPA: ribonuclease III [Stellaceae bacterium]|nr:ribonuclease III [Stellaceae bacterium]
MSDAPCAELERLIGHPFAHSELLAEALTHPSALSPNGRARRRTRQAAPRGDYERLEFLGDRVLGLVVADMLWRRFPHEAEGPLTGRHAQLVRRTTLAAIGGEIGLDRFIRLSPAEATAGGARNPAIIADVVEAVIAAVYLDGGFAAAFAFVEQFWGARLADMQHPPRDPKTLLQEWAQGRRLPLPAYELVATTGPDHARRFTVAVRVEGHDDASATASSKRGAETAAAAALLERLGQRAGKESSSAPQ